MLKKSAVENILAAALESGADFAEIYAERTKRSSIAMVNGKVETALGGMDYGAGVLAVFRQGDGGPAGGVPPGPL